MPNGMLLRIRAGENKKAGFENRLWTQPPNGRLQVGRAAHE